MKHFWRRYKIGLYASLLVLFTFSEPYFPALCYGVGTKIRWTNIVASIHMEGEILAIGYWLNPFVRTDCDIAIWVDVKRCRVGGQWHDQNGKIHFWDF